MAVADVGQQVLYFNYIVVWFLLLKEWGPLQNPKLFLIERLVNPLPQLLCISQKETQPKIVWNNNRKFGVTHIVLIRIKCKWKNNWEWYKSNANTKNNETLTTTLLARSRLISFNSNLVAQMQMSYTRSCP